MDITEHPTLEGKVYLDGFSRRVIDWSIADHMRAELVADALQMATWRRQPPHGQTIAHADHGGQYTSWLFGTRLREAGLLGSIGSVGDCFDNSVAEAFFSGLQRDAVVVGRPPRRGPSRSMPINPGGLGRGLEAPPRTGLLGFSLWAGLAGGLTRVADDEDGQRVSCSGVGDVLPPELVARPSKPCSTASNGVASKRMTTS
jgi:transposase InsO family protein